VASEKNFVEWMKTNGKKYTSKLEHIHRYKIWSQTIDKINTWNSEKTYGSARFAPSQYADRSVEEIRSSQGLITRPKQQKKKKT